MATVDIKGVEVLTPGIWNGIPISRRDLEDMVAAFDATSGALPVNIRLGHDARQAFARALFGPGGKTAAADEHGWPALGWAERLYLKGDTLLADVSGVPERLAQWVKERRYRTRSGGLRFNRAVDGHVYRWALDHIAILGADTPAVDGLADIGLSDDDVDREVEITFSASDADGLLTFGDAMGTGDAGEAETALDRLVAGLTALFDEHAPLIYGRKGGPMARSLFTAFLAKLRDSARSELPLSNGGNDMLFGIEALKGLLNLSADSTTADVTAALATVDKEGAGQLWNMAAALGIKDANGLALALGIVLGMSATDYDAIAAKVMELAGVEPAAPSEAPAPEAMPPAPGLSAAPEGMVELSAVVMRQQAEIETLKAREARRDAEARVRLDLAGKNVPGPVFETLVNLSTAGDTAGYQTVLGIAPAVPTSEKGSAGRGEADVELSAIELEFAEMHGVTPEQMKAQKLANARTGA